MSINDATPQEWDAVSQREWSSILDRSSRQPRRYKCITAIEASMSAEQWKGYLKAKGHAFEREVMEMKDEY